MTRPLDMTISVGDGGRLVSRTLHRHLYPGDPSSEWAVINLKGLQWIDPAGLVAIAVFAEEQAMIGRRPQLVAPSDSSRSRYLSRMHLGEVIEDLGGVHDLDPTKEWDRASRLLELQRFDGKDAAEALGDKVYARLEDDPSLAHAMHASICELGANVPDHSGRDHGYIAAVSTPATSRMSFAVGDAGVGMLEPLWHLGYGSDGEVLHDLLEIGLTRTGEPGRGRGIITTRRMVNGRGGELFVMSGTASATASPTHIQVTGHRHGIRGTLLQGQMPSL